MIGAKVFESIAFIGIKGNCFVLASLKLSLSPSLT